MKHAQSQSELADDRSGEKPETRTAASAPEATKHLSTQQEQALELNEESQHAIGAPREEMIKAAHRKSADEQTSKDE